MTLSTFSASIKAKTLELGFSKVGITRAEELGEEGSRLREWLNRGYDGTMEWMKRTAEKRTHPRLLMPSARSIVSVALNYYTPHTHSENPNIGKISRYAWGDDYHDVLYEKLVQLFSWIKEQCPEAEGKICVDANPAMDKVWAERAGLGWIGKHSNLITREFGSWVFLGELFLNLELAYDTDLVPDHCGTCTACLEACPTHAIVEPYVVDSRLCISYATIECKDEILGIDTEQWIMGCDICQDVCPWSRFSKETKEEQFQPREGNLTPLLEELARMSEGEFAQRFKGSAIKRPKHRGFIRNVKAVLKKREG